MEHELKYEKNPDKKFIYNKETYSYNKKTKTYEYDYSVNKRISDLEEDESNSGTYDFEELVKIGSKHFINIPILRMTISTHRMTSNFEDGEITYEYDEHDRLSKKVSKFSDGKWLDCKALYFKDEYNIDRLECFLHYPSCMADKIYFDYFYDLNGYVKETGYGKDTQNGYSYIDGTVDLYDWFTDLHISKEEYKERTENGYK
jgi:hypothetical protein